MSFGRLKAGQNGVAPAHLSVLPACKSVALVLGILLILLCLSLFRSESWLET
jgi:hypothetical protein